MSPFGSEMPNRYRRVCLLLIWCDIVYFLFLVKGKKRRKKFKVPSILKKKERKKERKKKKKGDRKLRVLFVQVLSLAF